MSIGCYYLVLADMDACRLNGVHFVSHLSAIRCLLITNNRLVTTFDNICELNIYIHSYLVKE